MAIVVGLQQTYAQRTCASEHSAFTLFNHKLHQRVVNWVEASSLASTCGPDAMEAGGQHLHDQG